MLYALRMAGECRVGGFSRQGTAMIKGVAILTMLFHHFFGAYHVDSGITQAVFANRDFCALSAWAWEAKVCVALFAFVTGYGYYVTAGRDTGCAWGSGFRRLRRFYPLFIAFCLLHILLCYCCPFQDALNDQQVPHYLLTMVGLLSAAPDYWYICVVILGALLFYPVLLAARRCCGSIYLVAFIGLSLLSITWIRDEVFVLILSCFTAQAEEIYRYVLSRSLYLVSLPWMIYFLVGWAVAAVSLRLCVTSVLLLTVSSAVLLVNVPQFPFWVGSFPCILLTVWVLQRVDGHWVGWLVLLGKYSACMWLNHRLIFGYWFADFFYGLPTPLNYLLLVGVSLGVSVAVMWVWEEWVMGGRKKRRHDDAAA